MATTQNLLNLKIHKLSQKQYDNLETKDPNAFYLTPDTGYVTTGQKTGTTIGVSATAEGEDTTASGYAAHAEGNRTTARGMFSHAEGTKTIAYGENSHAEGCSTGGHSSEAIITAIENESTVPLKMSRIDTMWNSSKFSIAYGKNSRVGGNDCVALGQNSFAHGCESWASSDNSAAFGVGIKAAGLQAGQFVVGSYNDCQAGTLFEVGNGVSSDSRHNAFEVYKSGSVRVYNAPTDSNDVVRLADLKSIFTITGETLTIDLGVLYK